MSYTYLFREQGLGGGGVIVAVDGGLDDLDVIEVIVI